MVLIAAHMGGPVGARNSVGSVKETINQGIADLIEIDVWQTKDGFVCTHGGRFGFWAVLRFHKCHSDHLKKKGVAALEDVVKVVGNKIPLLVHYKSFVIDFPKLLKALKPVKKVIFMSNKWDQIGIASGYFETVYFGWPFFSSIRRASKLGAKGFEFSSLDIPSASVRLAKASGLYFSAAGYHPVWLSQNRLRLSKAIRLGARWVVVDDPVNWKNLLGSVKK